MNRVKDKVVLVAGAGGAVGAAAAHRLAAEGAKVLATDREPAAAAAVAADIVRAGGTAHGTAQDVSQAADWDRAIAEARRLFGRLDSVVNTAQVYLKKSIKATSLAELRSLEETNFVGNWLAAKHALPAMRESGGGGSFVVVSSVLGQVGMADAAAYGAIAGALRIFVQSVALECGAKNDGIRANAVLAGPEPVAAMPVAKDNADGVINLPKANDSDAEGIAEAIVYLVSDESRFVTASAMVIDSGYSAA